MAWLPASRHCAAGSGHHAASGISVEPCSPSASPPPQAATGSKVWVPGWSLPIHARRKFPFSTAIRQAVASIACGSFSRTIIWLISLSTARVRSRYCTRSSACLCSVISTRIPSMRATFPWSSRLMLKPRTCCQR